MHIFEEVAKSYSEFVKRRMLAPNMLVMTDAAYQELREELLRYGTEPRGYRFPHLYMGMEVVMSPDMPRIPRFRVALAD